VATEPDRKIFATVLAAALAFGGAGCAKQPSEKTVAKPRMGFAVSATGALSERMGEQADDAVRQ